MKPVFICFLLILSFDLRAEGNALAEAMPNVSELTTESCSAKQSKLLGSFGLGEMACSISKHISFDSLGKALGISAFQSGSRTNPLAPSDNPDDFVRYSPAFFNRVNELYMKDPDIFVYDFLYSYFLEDSARLFYLNGKQLRDSQRLQGLTMEQYKTSIKNARTLYKTSADTCRQKQASQFRDNPAYTKTFGQCGKSGTAVMFWYRRQLDGSSDSLYQLLDNVIKTQDAEFHQLSARK